MEYNLFMGGQSGNATQRLLQSGGAETILGYADHQRARDYAVTRQLNFGPTRPWGGENVSVSQKDYCWYQELLGRGVDVVGGIVDVGDILNLIVIPPNTRLNYVSVNVLTPGKVGLTFDVIRRTRALVTDPFDEVQLPAAVEGYIASAAGMGQTKGIYTSTRLIETGGAPNSMPTQSYVSLAIRTVPAAPAHALDGLVVHVQAEVEDWGSYDFNGNV